MRRILLAVVVLMSAGVFAADKRGRSKAIGEAKEDDAPMTVFAVAATPPAPASGNDVALLRGLVWSFEPNPTEIRIIAIEDLGLLGDARALNPLAQLVVDPNPAVQVAALRAVSLIRHPRAEEILCNVVRHTALPERLKVKALDWVVFQRTQSSQSFIRQVAQSASFSRVLQTQAQGLLRTAGGA